VTIYINYSTTCLVKKKKRSRKKIGIDFKLPIACPFELFVAKIPSFITRIILFNSRMRQNNTKSES
jgi:hypothetical protein